MASGVKSAMLGRWGPAARRAVAVSIEARPRHFAEPPLARGKGEHHTVAGVRQPVGRTGGEQPTEYIPGHPRSRLLLRCRGHTEAWNARRRRPQARRCKGTLLPFPAMQGATARQSSLYRGACDPLRRRKGNVQSGRHLDRHAVLRIGLAPGRIPPMMLYES
jgi:hypothetical protein